MNNMGSGSSNYFFQYELQSSFEHISPLIFFSEELKSSLNYLNYI